MGRTILQRNIYKKMKTLIILFISVSCFSQNIYLSVGADVKNGILGSKPTNNKPAFDGIYRFGMIGDRIECVASYENFNRIKFDRYYLSVGYHIPITNKIIIIPAYEVSLINRWGNEWQTTSSHLAFLGANIAFRYKASNKISLEFLTAILNRVDLNTRYGGNTFKISNSINLIYKI